MSGKFGDLLDGGKRTYREGFGWFGGPPLVPEDWLAGPVLNPHPIEHRQSAKASIDFFKCPSGRRSASEAITAAKPGPDKGSKVGIHP